LNTEFETAFEHTMEVKKEGNDKITILFHHFVYKYLKKKKK